MKLIRLSIIIICLLTSISAWAKASMTLNISGVDDPLKQNISKLLKQEYQQTTAPSEQQRMHNFYQTIPQYVTDALQPYGYFEPIAQKSITRQVDGWTIQLHINPGPALKISAVTVRILGDGNQDPAFNRLLMNFPIQIGQVLNADKYDDAKNSLFNLAAQRGYFDAAFTKSQMIIDLEHYSAQIVLIFDSGKRYRFGPTQFPESSLKPSFLQRYLQYQTGTLYNNEQLQRTQQDLAASNYFKQVVLTPEPSEAINGNVPIHAELVPSDPRQYIFGLGYGTDTGPRGTLGLKLRQLNSSGHYLNTLVRASPRNSTLTADYNIPGRRPAYDLYSLSAATGQIDQDTGNSYSVKVGGSYSTVWRRWRTVLGIYFLNENYQLEDLPKTRAKMLIPNLHLEHLHRRALVNVSKGYNFTFDISGANETLLSSDTFIQEKIEGKILYTLPTHTRLIAHGELGRTDINNIDHLPLSLQLFAGGARSIRGYSYNSIGPGRNLVVASGEIQQRIHGNFYLAAFYDVGNVGNGNIFDNLRQGIGPGIVWLSPIGSLELTAARRISKDIDHDSWRIQFAMGPDL